MHPLNWIAPKPSSHAPARAAASARRLGGGKRSPRLRSRPGAPSLRGNRSDPSISPRQRWRKSEGCGHDSVVPVLRSRTRRPGSGEESFPRPPSRYFGPGCGSLLGCAVIAEEWEVASITFLVDTGSPVKDVEVLVYRESRARCHARFLRVIVASRRGPVRTNRDILNRRSLRP
jgi:hypothetical protein